FLGGEPIAVRRLWQWLGSEPFRAEVTNTYGPTEATDICAFYRIKEPQNFLDLNVPIGRSIANSQVYVLDRYGEPVPDGVVGELWVGGVGVGTGYLNDVKLTAERFVPDSLGGARGSRLYATGRCARWLQLEREKGPADRHELPNGMAIAHMNSSETDFLYREIFEEESYLKNGIALPKGACIFDVGANIGLFSLFVASRVPDATIYAFEPLPPLLEALQFNTGVYGVDIRLFGVG